MKKKLIIAVASLLLVLVPATAHALSLGTITAVPWSEEITFNAGGGAEFEGEYWFVNYDFIPPFTGSYNINTSINIYDSIHTGSAPCHYTDDEADLNNLVAGQPYCLYFDDNGEGEDAVADVAITFDKASPELIGVAHRDIAPFAQLESYEQPYVGEKSLDDESVAKITVHVPYSKNIITNSDIYVGVGTECWAAMLEYPVDWLPDTIYGGIGSYCEFLFDGTEILPLNLALEVETPIHLFIRTFNNRWEQTYDITIIRDKAPSILDGQNPKTGDINVLIIAATSLVALAGAAITAIYLKKTI